METFIETKKLVEIDLDSSAEHSQIGVCLKDAEVTILVNLKLEEQTFDGFSVFRSDDIERYRDPERYEYEKSALSDFNSLLDLSLWNSFENSLLQAAKMGLIAFFEEVDWEDYYVGALLSIEDNLCTFQLVDIEGQDSSLKTIKLEEIIYFSFYTEYERELAQKNEMWLNSQ